MSNVLEDAKEPRQCSAGETGPCLTPHRAVSKELGGGLTIRRLLPVRDKRMIGSWCFLDHFGPISFENKLMDVGTHPHIGLQTVTWLFEGEVQHRDSLGYEQVIRPGQLNLMTAGKGISHSEETPPEHSGRLHGLQFWIALPPDQRECEPDFQHIAEPPKFESGGVTITVFLGSHQGHTSEANLYTPGLGLELAASGPSETRLPLQVDFEHGLIVTEGTAETAGGSLESGTLYELGRGREELVIRTNGAARVVVFGGPPYKDPLVMWWNFVGGSHEEIAQARKDWEETDRFGDVANYPGDRLPAPELTTNLRPR